MGGEDRQCTGVKEGRECDMLMTGYKVGTSWSEGGKVILFNWLKKKKKKNFISDLTSPC